MNVYHNPNPNPNPYPHYRRTLAPYETMELHELLSFYSTALYEQKSSLEKLRDPELRQLLLESIQLLESNAKEIMALLQYRPMQG